MNTRLAVSLMVGALVFSLFRLVAGPRRLTSSARFQRPSSALRRRSPCPTMKETPYVWQTCGGRSSWCAFG
jgi:hypothetical protein